MRRDESAPSGHRFRLVGKISSSDKPPTPTDEPFPYLQFPKVFHRGFMIWEMNDEVMMENWGGSVDPENEPPVITGTGPQTMTLPNSVTLSATAQDDARPKPRRQRNPEDGGQGLSVRWIVYRAAGPVTFAPATRATGYGTPVTSTTTASFKVPGTYVLRAIAAMVCSKRCMMLPSL